MNNNPIIVLKPTLAQGRIGFGAPYDTTLGIPHVVFIVAWILIMLFLARLAWEYRDKLFGMKRPIAEKPKRERKKKKKAKG